MTASIGPAPTELASKAQDLGTASSWSLDLAWIGALSSSLAPAAVASFLGGTLPATFAGFAVCAGLAGGLTGAALGPALRRLFCGPLRRAKVGPLLAAGAGAGAAWGATVGGVAAWFSAPELAPLAVVFGGVAGAIQLGWFWLPYVIRRGRGRSTLPVMITASILAPSLGFAALFGLGLIASLLGVFT